MPPTIDPDVGCVIPAPGEWPIAPQHDVSPREDHLWVDGCFDFFHHGHAGLLLQSRRLCAHLTIGIHSDAAITANKGPPVMNLAERAAAVTASRFASLCVPDAPYVTSLAWVGHYGCWFVGHGDDVSSDAQGEDCYRFVKRAGRMRIVKRTEGISTTDLVGRMLEGGMGHHIGSLAEMLAGREGGGREEERRTTGARMATRIREYAAAHNGRDPYVQIHTYKPSTDAGASFTNLVAGHSPRPGQRIVYLDGAFDLFSSGHIAFLQLVTQLEDSHGRAHDWYSDAARSQRIEECGEDYGPAYIIAGIHDDAVVNTYRRGNYPIMSIFERGLCVVQCRYIHAVIFAAPYIPSQQYLSALPALAHSDKRVPDAVYHGPLLSPSSSVSTAEDPYADAKALGIFVETPEHAFQEVNAAQIVRRILDKRAEYEERQRKKGVKGVGEREKEAEEARVKKVGGG
ncbi:hypothetical protein LTR08_003314 [Meristemomyces frigidus]|nr:hypothetical protein LTR08_003314 [Meristemomyces frigidus]